MNILEFRETPQFYAGGSLMVDLAGPCNLKCSFCWAAKKHERPGKEMSVQHVFDKIQEKTVTGKKLSHVCLTGTEPLLQKKDVIELTHLFDKAEKTPILVIQTNGSLIDQAFLDAIPDNQKMVLRISLKGINAQDFAQNSGANPEKWEQIWQNIKISGKKINVLIAVISPNAKKPNDISEIMERCNKLDPSGGLAEDLEIEKIINYIGRWKKK